MSEPKPTRGGAREGAGRKEVKDKVKSRTVCMNDADYAKYQKLGGARWFKKMLDSAEVGK